jgi:tripartite-type tricarboxylate transporter receptor subunit TctC
LVGLAGSLGVTMGTVSANALECRNLEMIVGWGAGGGTDIFMRTLAVPLSDILKIPVKVINGRGR